MEQYAEIIGKHIAEKYFIYVFHNRLISLISFLIRTGDDCTPDDYASMALHFEQKKQHLLAGKFFSKAGQYNKVSVENQFDYKI